MCVHVREGERGAHGEEDARRLVVSLCLQIMVGAASVREEGARDGARREER